MTAIFVTCFVLYVIVGGLFWLISWVNDSTIESSFNSLTKSLNSCTCIDESVIQLVFDNQVKDTKITYASFVEKYRLHLLDGHINEVKEIEKVDLLLQEIINREQLSLYSSGLDENEWRAMVAIENAVHDGESLLIVKKNLRLLSDLIRKNKKNLATKERRNKWSFFFTILGVLLTIFAFIWGARISKNDYNDLNGRLENIGQKVDALSLGQNELMSIIDIEDK